MQNLLAFLKFRSDGSYSSRNKFFAQPAAAKLKIKATISCFFAKCMRTNPMKNKGARTARAESYMRS